MFFIYLENTRDIDTSRGLVMCLSHVPEESSLPARGTSFQPLVPAFGPLIKSASELRFASSAYKVDNVH